MVLYEKCKPRFILETTSNGSGGEAQFDRNRTILVLNSAFGDAKDLPFDILQHRWPIEYRLTEHTQVREKRYATLAETLSTALHDCVQHELARAAAMADALDTSCLDFVAMHEDQELIEMPLPAKTMGQVLMGLEFNLAARRLMELGAIRVVSEPHLGYGWTYDGRIMIRHLNTVQPHLTELSFTLQHANSSHLRACSRVPRSQVIVASVERCYLEVKRIVFERISFVVMHLMVEKVLPAEMERFLYD